jgi:tetratricopeptide (TPR) repeat protein
MGSVHLNLGNIAYSRGEYDEAERMFDVSLGHYRRANSPVWIAGCLTNLSALALAREDLDRVETLQSEALRIYEAAGIRDQICLSLLQFGIAAFVRGDHDQARARWERSLALARELDLGWNIIAALENIAFLELSHGRPEETRGLLIECIARLKDMFDPVIALPTIEAVADVVARTRPAEAASILAAATALRASLQLPLLSFERVSLRRLEARLAQVLSGEELARARADGERSSLEDALSTAERLIDPQQLDPA